MSHSVLSPDTKKGVSLPERSSSPGAVMVAETPPAAGKLFFSIGTQIPDDPPGLLLPNEVFFWRQIDSQCSNASVQLLNQIGTTSVLVFKILNSYISWIFIPISFDRTRLELRRVLDLHPLSEQMLLGLLAPRPNRPFPPGLSWQ